MSYVFKIIWDFIGPEKGNKVLYNNRQTPCSGNYEAIIIKPSDITGDLSSTAKIVYMFDKILFKGKYYITYFYNTFNRCYSHVMFNKWF